MEQDIKQFYQQADSHRWGRFDDQKLAETHFAKYIGFIRSIAVEGKLLDIGCSPGWSALLLAQRGFDVTALDMNQDAFLEDLRNQTPRLAFQQGDVTQMSDIPDNTYDVVSSYQMLEHVEDPQTALSEMLRVTKPGGYLVVAGPNLLSPVHTLRTLLEWIPKEQSFKHWWIKNPNDPHKPFGNTMPQACAIGIHNLSLLLSKRLSSIPTFNFRTPDFTPPCHGDSDAVYLLNPLDIIRFLKSRQCKILSTKGGRMAFLGSLAGGTWIAAKKFLCEP